MPNCNPLRSSYDEWKLSTPPDLEPTPEQQAFINAQENMVEDLNDEVQRIARHVLKTTEKEDPFLDLDILCSVKPCEDRAELALEFSMCDVNIQDKDDLCQSVEGLAAAVKLFYEQLAK